VRALQRAEESVPDGFLEKWFARPTTLTNEYSQQALANPEAHRYCCDNAYVDNKSDVAEVLEEAFTTLPTRKSFALWFSMAPTSRRPLPDMALSLHSDHYFAIYVVWEDVYDDGRCQSWARSIMRDVAPQSIGQYLGDADFQVRNTKYWGAEQGRKLTAVRKRWDPFGKICGYLDSGDHSGANGLTNALASLKLDE
jgi:hypothetical protein